MLEEILFRSFWALAAIDPSGTGWKGLSRTLCREVARLIMERHSEEVARDRVQASDEWRALSLLGQARALLDEAQRRIPAAGGAAPR